MRLLSAAIILSFVAVTASAQTTLRMVSPGLGTLRNTMPFKPPPGPAPLKYTVQQRAATIQNILHLPSQPTLGQPVTLTPGAPVIAGLAELDFNHATVWDGTFAGGPVGGVAVLFNGEGGAVQINFSARAGQRYAIDCRAGASSTPISYDISPAAASGTVTIGQDGHFLIAMDKAPADGLATVVLYQDRNAPLGWRFYGCDISPF